jgi:hypothetical protein
MRICPISAQEMPRYGDLPDGGLGGTSANPGTCSSRRILMDLGSAGTIVTFNLDSSSSQIARITLGGG